MSIAPIATSETAKSREAEFRRIFNKEISTKINGRKVVDPTKLENFLVKIAHKSATEKLLYKDWDEIWLGLGKGFVQHRNGGGENMTSSSTYYFTDSSGKVWDYAGHVSASGPDGSQSGTWYNQVAIHEHVQRLLEKWDVNNRNNKKGVDITEFLQANCPKEKK